MDTKAYSYLSMQEANIILRAVEDNIRRLQNDELTEEEKSELRANKNILASIRSIIERGIGRLNFFTRMIPSNTSEEITFVGKTDDLLF